MKSIAYKDNGNPRNKLFIYNQPGMGKKTRLVSAIKELKQVGNISIYLVYGNKQRKIINHNL